jgi:anti-sigma factor RsiW
MSVCHLTDREILQCLDGELPQSQRRAVERHLNECDICADRRAAIASTASAVSADYRAAKTTPAECSRARLEATLARSADAAERPRFTIAPAIAAAAAVALLATATIYLSAPADQFAVRHRLSLPVATITPGATADVSVEELCSGTPRLQPITAAMRAQVLSAYGVENVPPEQYELDYLITPELGGATDVRNLWPQRYGSPVWNARVKDELEELLPRLVCSRQLGLATAQRDMASDWIAAYKKYFNTDVPLEAHRGPAIDNDDVYLLADAGAEPFEQDPQHP